MIPPMMRPLISLWLFLALATPSLFSQETTLPNFSSPWLREHAIVIDKDTNSVFINASETFLATLRPSFPEIQTLTDLIGKDDFYFYSDADAQKFRADDRRVMDRGIPLEIFETNEPVGGPRTTVQVVKYPLRRTNDGSLFGLRIIFWELPSIQVNRGAAKIDLSFTTNAAGFDLERSSLLLSNWTAVVPFQTNGASITTSIPTDSAMDFFRLQVREDAPTNWVPERPITLVVPFGVNGSSDQLARLFARILEPSLGQKIYVVNLPGNSAATGTKAVLDAPRDGYTWRAGLASDIGLYKITGLLETRIEDWHPFLPVSYSQIFSVSSNSPHQNFGDLLAAFKAQPGKIRVGTAGRVATGSVAMQLLAEKTGIQFSNVFYNSGAEVAAACANGDVEVMAQTFSDGANLMLAGRLRPLANISPNALIIPGLSNSVPPVKDWVPGLEATGNYFGFFLPKGTPLYVLKTVQDIFDRIIPTSPEFAAYAEANGANFVPVTGAAAQVEVMKYISKAAWSLYDAGATLYSPEIVGIPRP
jgi:tripartite-type tricarboxylate transporter receptor subunit TctC